MKVGYLTIVFADDATEKTARHLVTELADEALSYESVEIVKCDIGEFGPAEIDAFNAEAAGA